MLLPAVLCRLHHGKDLRNSSTALTSPLWVSDVLFFLIYTGGVECALACVVSAASGLWQRRDPEQSCSEDLQT